MPQQEESVAAGRPSSCLLTTASSSGVWAAACPPTREARTCRAGGRPNVKKRSDAEVRIELSAFGLFDGFGIEQDA